MIEGERLNGSVDVTSAESIAFARYYEPAEATTDRQRQK